ncbi:MAG TPA: CPBP family glutamic-type intramembrane protease [Verrucomicrobiae bacterium]|nr:CPBP family glutamic-type intramembrane protease [Verrucomicrobiae bacterium]
MSFATLLNTSRLPEKPWTTGAVVRLGVCVIIGMMMGAVAGTIVRYFETPQNSSVIAFLALAAAAFASYVGALVMLARPWPLEDRYLGKLIGLLTLIYAGILFTWLSSKLIKGDAEVKNPISVLLLSLAFFQGLALVMVHFFLREHCTGWREGFGLGIRPWHALLTGICAGALVLYPVLGLNGFFFHLFDKLSLHPHEQQQVEILRHADSLLARVALGFGTVFIAPVAEEVIFRGILYPVIKRRFSQQIALWGTACLFGAIHLNLAGFVPLMLLAVILAMLYEYTGNLLAPIAVHCVFNAANFVALYMQQN